MNHPAASVIIAFYNHTRFLKLVLEGLKRQSDKNFEVVIADDGSRPEVVDEINDLTNSYPFRIRHCWHEDKGWRKNMILNNAVVASESDYLIFIDSDCIPHRHFISEHLLNREKRVILSGRRVNLSESVTEILDTVKVQSGYLEVHILNWLLEGLKGKFTHAEKGLYLPWLTFFLTKKNYGLLGSNFSIYKEDLLSLNGFDERYLAPTVGEDTELEYRAGLAGIKIKSVRNLAIQYHLYHPKLSRVNDNWAIFEDTKSKGMSRTPYGILKENGAQ